MPGFLAISLSGLTNRFMVRLIIQIRLAKIGQEAQITASAVKERTMALGILLYWAYVCSTYLSLLRQWVRG
jgi:hypothetical protein